MAVYIRGMEMPSCCMFCPLSNSAGCGLSNPPIIMTSKEMLAGRPDWCPLVPVPPHGRLIDADKLLSQYKGNIWTAQTDYAEGLRDVANDIKQAPTVIEAEEGEP